MNQNTIKSIASQIEAAVQEIAKANNVQIKRGNARYDGTSATLKLDITDIIDGKVISKDVTAFEEKASYLGMKPEWLDKEVILSGTKFKIVGLNTRAYKKPVNIVRISDGGKFKTSSQDIISAMS